VSCLDLVLLAADAVKKLDEALLDCEGYDTDMDFPGPPDLGPTYMALKEVSNRFAREAAALEDRHHKYRDTDAKWEVPF